MLIYSSIVLKSKDGSKLKNFAFDDFEDVTVQQLERVTDSEIISAAYNTQEGILYVRLSEYDNTGSYFACDFILSVDGREYHLRGNAFSEPGNWGHGLIFTQTHMKHVNLNGATDIKIKYVKPEQEDRGICSFAGKPMESTDFIAVTIEE